MHRQVLNQIKDFCILIHFGSKTNLSSRQRNIPKTRGTPDPSKKGANNSPHTWCPPKPGAGRFRDWDSMPGSTRQVRSGLRTAINTDIERLENSIVHLQASLSSLAGVVLPNKQGLDLIFLQQGRLCTALGEECHFYVDHSGVVRGFLAKARQGLAKCKRE